MKRILTVLGLALGAFLIFVFATARRDCLIAESFLADIKKLRVGSSSFPDVQEVLRKYDRFQAGSDAVQREFREPIVVRGACSADNCGARLVFYNMPIAYLMMASPLEFSTDLSIKNGHLTSVSMTIVTRKSGHEAGVQLIESEEHSKQMQDLIIDPVHGTRKGMSVDGNKLYLRPNASPESKNRAYAFNVNCLSRISGCSTPEQIHPLAVP